MATTGRPQAIASSSDWPSTLRSDRDGTLDVTVAALSTAAYKAVDRIPRSHWAPSVTMDVPATGRDRLEVGAHLSRDQFAEVTFLAKVGRGGWQDIGTDDNAPYRVIQFAVNPLKPW